ncbi:hypothetical protein UT300012_40870 [Paraclostridium bifermentans]|uniref:Peptidoglycan-binding protein n=1 Tax=Paraclostridium bifermentans TaxID=1490 RepID=A0AA44DK45_PARBF|nr:peptidoglycan-binding domain-containing protein [Paraclostridium bifermentans]MBN8046931.1 peptidoglycan-binding protein [Paraclostridium bifermentans]NME08997.1 peptidoglycan-binding protein [Paraclostridium bifermentans]
MKLKNKICTLVLAGVISIIPILGANPVFADEQNGGYYSYTDEQWKEECKELNAILEKYDGQTFELKSPMSSVNRASRSYYSIGFEGGKIKLWKDGKQISYFTPTNRENIVGYGYVTRGNQVLAAQVMLNFVMGSTYSKISEDGIFGSGTYNKAKYFQSTSGLKSDGVVGPSTWAKMLKIYGY